MRRAMVAGLLLASGAGLAVAGIVAFARPTAIPELRVDEKSGSSRFANVTDKQFCELSRKDAEQVNNEAPITIDMMTRVVGVVVVCSQRTITYNKSVSGMPSGLRPGWRENYQRGHDQTTCENELFATMTRRGWRFAQRVSFANGEYATFETSACPSK